MMRVLQETVLLKSTAKCLGEQHSLLFAEQIIMHTEPQNGEDTEWKGQSCLYSCLHSLQHNKVQVQRYNNSKNK